MFLILDSGAGPNLLKRNNLAEKTAMNKNEIFEIKGITDNSIFTLGKIKLYFFKFAVEFHTANNDFPIKEDGLLGSDFFSQLKTKIDYETKQLIISDLSVPFYEENEQSLVD